MPKPTWSEIYLVGGLMVLTVIISVVSIYIFVRQYKREKARNEKGEGGNRKREAEIVKREGGNVKRET